MLEIGLTKGKVVIVDDDAPEEVTKYSWHFTSTGYAARRETVGYKTTRIQYMHRLIMGCDIGHQVDHINGNKLDNRKSNLRLVTSQQNSMNSRVRESTKSGYKGVSWSSQKSKWRSRGFYGGKETHLGFFNNKNDAARAYNSWANEVFGEFAKLNDINEEENE